MIAHMVTIRPGRTSGGSAGHAVSSQCLGSRSGGILDSPGVVVLVASERGASSKRLLAIGIRALIGPLTRVYATVPSQRTAVTKGLWGSSQLQVLIRADVWVLTFPQRSHMCGFSPVWTR